MHLVQARVTKEFAVGIFIEILYSVALLMETLVAAITVDDFVLFTYICRKANLAVRLKCITKFWFGKHKILYGCLEKLFLLAHVFLLILLDPHTFQSIGKHLEILFPESEFEIDQIVLPFEKLVDIVDVLFSVVALFDFLDNGFLILLLKIVLKVQECIFPGLVIQVFYLRQLLLP